MKRKCINFKRLGKTDRQGRRGRNESVRETEGDGEIKINRRSVMRKRE